MTEPTAEDRGALMTTVFAPLAAHALATAVRLELPDRIGDAERDAAAVAADLGTHREATLRLLRALASSGVLTEPRPGVFALTARGALLRSDRPDSLAAFVTTFLEPAMVSAWSHLDQSVRTGRVMFDDLNGTDFFAYLADHPDLSLTFNASMRQGTHATAAVLPGLLDLATATTITDVGGGDGTLLAAVLARHPHLRGVLFDSPQGVAEAGPVLEGAGVAGRCEVATGDFFTAVPTGSEVYLLKSVVHDWPDDRVATILGHVREVIPNHGRLIVVEPVLPATVDESMPPLMYLADLNMLVNVSGRERTEAEFRTVFERAGFRVTRVTALPAAAGFSMIEALPV